MLPIDLSRPARSHADQHAIVEAVVAAGPEEQETDWIEWKSTLDISVADGAFKVARSLLGFGNRDPDYAARYARGCAYVIVGAEPGNVGGCAIHDTANIEQWISGYIRAGEPQWSATYVNLGGRSVLFITVEAPEYGNPIFTLQKGGAKANAGVIYVRRNGKTEPAGPDDIRRLEQRLLRREARVQLDLQWRDPPHIVPLADVSELARQFAANEAERLERFEYRSNALLGLHTVEMRSDEEYDEELDAYLQKAGERYRLLVQRAVIDANLTTFALEIVNPTDANFPKTQATIRLPGDVDVYFSSEDLEARLDEVRPPEPWGRGNIAALMPNRILGLRQIVAPDGRDLVRRDGETIVMLPWVDVRPHTPHTLQTLDLLLPAHYADELIRIPWRATSTGASGHVEGELELHVAAEFASPAVPTASPDDEL